MTRDVLWQVGEQYAGTAFGPEVADPDPFAQFHAWLAAAVAADVPAVNAMTLATIQPGGAPAARVVLLKELDARGLTFFTNFDSDKGQQLAADPRAAVVLYWHPHHRQIRVEGAVERVADAEADAYFAARPLGSRIGAIASPQSRVLPDRAALEQRVAEVAAARARPRATGALGRLPAGADAVRVLAGAGQPAARPGPLPARWRGLASGTPRALTPAPACRLSFRGADPAPCRSGTCSSPRTLASSRLWRADGVAWRVLYRTSMSASRAFGLGVAFGLAFLVARPGAALADGPAPLRPVASARAGTEAALARLATAERSLAARAPTPSAAAGMPSSPRDRCACCQRASWRRDRQLREQLATSQATARARRRRAGGDRGAHRGRAARAAVVAAVDAELRSPPSRARVRSALRARHAPPAAARRIVLPDGDLDPLADPEELEEQAQRLRAAERELATAIATLDRQEAALRRAEQLRDAHERA
ncbi:MAG: pyridoxal 5'-phosphate synthase [Kofleriaceae bacterium]